MAKIEIDNKKFWEAMAKFAPNKESLLWVNMCVESQGLKLNDNFEITTIESGVKWYVAIDDYGIYESIMSQVPIFHKGEMTTKEKVYTYFPNMTDEEFNKHFRPATEEEIPLKKTPVEVYHASVDSATKKPEQPKKCLFTKDLYTDEERKVFCEDCEEECEYNKKEEPVSNNLEEAANFYANTHTEWFDADNNPHVAPAFKAGAKWQKEHLWKSANGDDLPEYEREVVVFTQNFPDDAGIMRVAIGHRPNPDGWDGKSLTSGKVEHYTPKTYGKGGWNIPDVKFWLDVEYPKEIEL